MDPAGHVTTDEAKEFIKTQICPICHQHRERRENSTTFYLDCQDCGVHVMGPLKPLTQQDINELKKRRLAVYEELDDTAG